ncbi:MAG TPA: polysaccharide biosynthesis/export family protein [Bryobacteraceae bacterium]|jgi:polysaccharide export outer membrane protein|nr:polysaccharide biosynthesis/export family protein [Bryobacteraceae bacterium]
MQMLVKFVLAAVSTAALCCAQIDSSGPADGPSSVKNTTQGPTAGHSGEGETQVNQATATAVQPPPASQAGPQVVEKPEGKPEADIKTAARVKNTGSTADSKEGAFIFGPLDVIIVKVWDNPNLSSAYAVSQDGTISMPLVGDLKADGLTARQLKEVITQRLADCCIRTPEVTVEIGKINSKRYFVYGEVGRAGEYPLARATTVMDALSDVGGFRDFANTKKIRIQRVSPDGKTAKEFLFNYKDVSRGKHLDTNILLENGDRIYVQ